MREPVWTFEDARERIRSRLNGRTPRRLSIAGFRPAGVLIPILNRQGGPTILFTRRTETVNEHKGQISFPGGRAEIGEDLAKTALREAFEEVALDPEKVELASALDDHATVSSYMVTPFVGFVFDPPAAFTRQETEVIEPFEVPLGTLLDPTKLREEKWNASRMPPGTPVEALLKLRTDFEELDPVTQEWKVYFFDTGDAGRVIWGMTARVLKELLDRAFDFSRDPQRKLT